jgi:DNA-binding MarR family transcriptional regulator
VRRGLAERAEDPIDRRVKRVRTTRKGDRLVERLVAARLRSFERLLDGFTATERRKLGDALDEILARPEIARLCPSERRK